MTKDERKTLRELAAKSTQVVAWYAHEKEVRGPYNRWFTCSEVADPYRFRVASTSNDCAFAAAAMNNVLPLLDLIDSLEEKAWKYDQLSK